jgi:hypothetical protein
MITLERSISFSKVRSTSHTKGERQMKPAKATVPRISRLMALALRFDQLMRDGVVTDQAELARLGRVTRARLTQIMNLICLAPKIQEQILYMTTFSNKQNKITERHLRPISLIPEWKQQLEAWAKISPL